MSEELKNKAIEYCKLHNQKQQVPKAKDNLQVEMKQYREDIKRHMLQQNLSTFNADGLFFSLTKVAPKAQTVLTTKTVSLYYHAYLKDNTIKKHPNNPFQETQQFYTYITQRHEAACNDVKKYGAWKLEIKTQPPTKDAIYDSFFAAYHSTTS